MQNLKEQLLANFPMIEQFWDQEIIPTLVEYIKIPNKSVSFDCNWKKNGFMDQAMDLLVNWCNRHPLEKMVIHRYEVEGRTPLLLVEIPGHSQETVLLYGHMDKQPEMTGWDENKGPWKPVIEQGKLYGRGGADDGYALFTAMTAISMLQKTHLPHARCLILIEASEESGSVDLGYYLKELKPTLGTPSLVICLDSGAGNYEQLWATTSLRGLIGGILSITVLKKSLHSGVGSGIVPSVFTVLRQLIDRIEDSKTGKVILDSLQADIPTQRITQAQTTAKNLGSSFLEGFQWCDQTTPIHSDIAELLLNRTWRPSLSITGIDGVPKNTNAGNVTLASIEAKLSLRIPPTLDQEKAQMDLKNVLEESPPFGAQVEYLPQEAGAGWNAPAMASWLEKASEEASMAFFNKHVAYIGEGGSIPFMGILGDLFPKTQFMVTGVLGPHSNAHGPNEFLHIQYAKQLTGCIAYLLATHYKTCAE